MTRAAVVTRHMRWFFLLSVEAIKQALCSQQIGRRESLSETAMHFREQISAFIYARLIA